MPTPEELEAALEALAPEIIDLTGGTSHTVVCEKTNTRVRTSLDDTVVTLPLASENSGKYVTVVNEAEAGAAKVTVSPQPTDKIVGSIDSQAASAVAGKGWVNTKATHEPHDHTVFASDGTDWVIAWNSSGIGGAGYWASEP